MKQTNEQRAKTDAAKPTGNPRTDELFKIDYFIGKLLYYFLFSIFLALLFTLI